MTARTRTGWQRASPDPAPKHGSGCIFDASISAEASSGAAKPPRWLLSAEAVSNREDSLGGRGASPPAEADWQAYRPRERCLPPASHRGGSQAQDTQWESDDVSHGVRILSAFFTQAIVVPVYLAGTVRSQSFSLSQRFHPAWALWLCFAPHPPLGFWPSELYPLSQP